MAIYNIFKANLMNGVVDLATDAIKVALYDSSHSFTATETDYVTTNEVLESADGYTRGGVTLGSTGVTGTTTVTWDAADATWSSATFTARHAVIWDYTLASDNLIANIDFGSDKEVTNGTFTIQWDAAGIITLAG